MTSGWQGARFEETRLGTCFKTTGGGCLIKVGGGGATVERLLHGFLKLMFVSDREM